jgi:hypothetical protein
MLKHPQTKESKMKRLWKSITLFAIANMIALAAPAHAGSNECVGYVLKGGHIVDDDNTWSSPIGDHCTFNVNSAVGRKILSKCPIGSACRIDLDLEASRNPIKRTLRIEKECDGRCQFIYDQKEPSR